MASHAGVADSGRIRVDLRRRSFERALPSQACRGPGVGRGGGEQGGEQGGRQDGSDRGTDLLITRDGFALASPTQPASFRACPRSPPGMTAFWAQRP